MEKERIKYLMDKHKKEATMARHQYKGNRYYERKAAEENDVVRCLQLALRSIDLQRTLMELRAQAERMGTDPAEDDLKALAAAVKAAADEFGL